MGAPIYLTIDMEEWFHLLECRSTTNPDTWLCFESRIEANTHRLLNSLDEHGAKATWFVLGWIAEHYPTLVREVQQRGHSVGCHSYYHSLVWQQTPAQFMRETRAALAILEDTCGAPITHYRAPGFSITQETPWAFEALAECGIRVDASVFPGKHRHGGCGQAGPTGPYTIQTPSGPILEYPMSLVSLGPMDIAYAGGGYFRLLPWALINHCIRRSPYTMTYFHPRDFDPDQPRVPGLSLVRHVRSGLGLRTALGKFNKIINTLSPFPIP